VQIFRCAIRSDNGY